MRPPLPELDIDGINDERLDSPPPENATLIKLTKFIVPELDDEERQQVLDSKAVLIPVMIDHTEDEDEKSEKGPDE